MSNKQDEAFDEDEEPEVVKDESEPNLLDELEASVPSEFAVTDEDSANWVVRKVAEARDRIKRMRESKKRADTEIKQQIAKEDFFLSRYESGLIAFAKSQLEGKKKSVKLFEGVIGFRSKTTKAHLSIIDEKAAMDWAKANLPEAVQVVTEERVNLALVLAHFKTNGEEPPGIQFVPEETVEEFYVK